MTPPIPTQQEQDQAKAFLQRAQIRTMHKDLASLREKDALQERDKIANIKTVQEQQAILQKQQQAQATAQTEKARRELVLQEQQKREYAAEKDLKQYATEQERQQIFLLESQRLATEKQVEAIEQQQEPQLQLQKNALLLEIQKSQQALQAIVAAEKKLDDEQKLITEQAQRTNFATERKALEDRRFELDKKIQDTEKQRWAAEKQVQDGQAKVTAIDGSLAQLTNQKNQLRQAIATVDTSLRNIYSTVVQREEDRKRNLLQEQQQKISQAAQLHAQQNEQVRSQQWANRQPQATPGQTSGKIPLKERLQQQRATEEDQRQRFLREVDQASQTGGNQQLGKSNIK